MSDEIPREISDELAVEHPDVAGRADTFKEETHKPFAAREMPKPIMTDFEKEALRLLMEIAMNIAALRQAVDDHLSSS